MPSGRIMVQPARLFASYWVLKKNLGYFKSIAVSSLATNSLLLFELGRWKFMRELSEKAKP